MNNNVIYGATGFGFGALTLAALTLGHNFTALAFGLGVIMLIGSME